MGEIMVCSMNEISKKNNYSCVRFGNVIGSSGSLIPILNEQISKGGPITITDKEATRYFMTVQDAVNLTIEASDSKNRGLINVLNMGKSINIYSMVLKILKDSNIKTIIDLKKRFKTQVGLSDHTPGIGASVAAVGYGATIIEKHFTMNKDSGGLDDSFSIDPNELHNLVIECRRAWESKGKVFYGVTKSEKKSLIFKRSIYTSAKIKKGEKFTLDNIKVIRPNLGLHPKYFNKILGKKCLKNLAKATALKKSYYIK